jgi:hypothetical protein
MMARGSMAVRQIYRFWIRAMAVMFMGATLGTLAAVLVHVLRRML